MIANVDETGRQMRSIRRLAIAAGGGIVMAVLAGCGGSDGGADEVANPGPTAPTSITVRGTIEAPMDFTDQMKRKHHYAGTTPCRTKDGYDDIREGAQVTVRDGDGSTVALGQLEAGVLGGEAGQSLYMASCGFGFVVADVPAGAGFYSVEVAHRGEVSYDEAQLEEPVTLTLGD